MCPIKYAGMVKKKMGPRWREIAPAAARGSQEERSRNIGPTFITIPVAKVEKNNLPQWFKINTCQ